MSQSAPSSVPVVLPSPAPQPHPAARPIWRRRGIFLLAVALIFFSIGWLAAPSFSPPQTSAADRGRALRFADETAQHATANNWREAFLSAGRARHADPSLPGMEAVIGQSLFNAGHLTVAAVHARASQKRGDSLSAAAILLGLEAWSRRGADPISIAHASLVSRLWLEHAASENLSDGAPRFFLAEIERLAGRPGPRDMLAVLHRLQPWESSAILDAKMHLAASEAGSQYNAAHFGRGLRLEASAQARALKNLRRLALVGADLAEAKRDLASVFTQRHLFVLAGDPALAGTASHSDRLTLVSPAPREPLAE